MRNCAALLLLGAFLFTETKADVISSDVSVELTGSPTSNLAPGQIIHFTLSLTNHGSESIPFLGIVSSEFYDEFDLSANANDCPLILNVLDGDTFFRYLYTWLPTLSSAISPGETRVCHFQTALSANAPTVVPLTFGLSTDFVDPDPSNNSATVYLSRPVESVPLLARVVSVSLSGLVAMIGMLFLRLRSQSVGSGYFL